MEKITEEIVAKEIAKSIGGKTTRGKETDINTLCDFGQLGLQTPLKLAMAFYNSFLKAKR